MEYSRHRDSNERKIGLNICDIYDDVKNIAAKYEAIEKVVLFGSRARGDNREKSDIDIAVFPREYPFKQEAAFWIEIEDIDTLLKFDIVVVNEDTEKELIENIEVDGVILYVHGQDQKKV